MEKLKNSWRNTPRSVRVPLVFIIGWIVVAAGLVMLVTPGPGWATIFLGFAILATEFKHAARVRDWLVARLKAVITWLQRIFKSGKKS